MEQTEFDNLIQNMNKKYDIDKNIEQLIQKYNVKEWEEI